MNELTDRCCSVVELRQYTLHAGRSDDLIDLFDREFVETQESVGVHVIGQFHDLDDADRFVWLRGFVDMDTRRDALASFYGGPVWTEHRDAANATMIDSDDVLLLRPGRQGSGLGHPPSGRDAYDAATPAAACPTVVEIVVHRLDDAAGRDADGSFTATFGDQVVPALAEIGAPVIGWWVTERADNTFPALPVRAGEHVLVAMTRFDDETAHRAHLAARSEAPAWRSLDDDVRTALDAPLQRLRLSPTGRSQLR